MRDPKRVAALLIILLLAACGSADPGAAQPSSSATEAQTAVAAMEVCRDRTTAKDRFDCYAANALKDGKQSSIPRTEADRINREFAEAFARNPLTITTDGNPVPVGIEIRGDTIHYRSVVAGTHPTAGISFAEMIKGNQEAARAFVIKDLESVFCRTEDGKTINDAYALEYHDEDVDGNPLLDTRIEKGHCRSH